MKAMVKPLLVGFLAAVLGVGLTLMVKHLWEDHLTTDQVRAILKAQQAQQAPQPAPPAAAK